MKSLFSGVIDDALAFPYPAIAPSEADAVAALLVNLGRFAQRTIDSARIDREERIPDEVFAGLRELGVMGMLVPRDLGGAGFSMSAYARVIQELAGIDSSIAVSVGAHQSIGTMGLLAFGTDAHKRKYVPRLASGEALASFALTEAGAGSDASSIATHAERVPGGFVLRGSKLWVTNGGLADVFTVFARTSPRGDDGAKPKLTAFILERAMGVRSGPSEHKLGIRGASTTPLFFDEIFVPDDHVLGEVGRGFRVAMETLNGGRLGLAAGCVGLAKHLIELGTGRAVERRAFGRAIGQFGLVKDKIAVMLAETYAVESAVYATTAMVDHGSVDFSIESAICKVLGSEVLYRVANETLQIAAGSGYMRDHPYERLLRDARINLIFEGTNEILRCFIALSGMSTQSESLSHAITSIREPIKGFGLLSDFALRKARSALGRERLSRVHPSLDREAAVFERHAVELARCSERALRKHGSNIAEMQYTQRRLADLAIDLYAVVTVLARTTQAIERRGEEGARRERELTRVFVAMADGRMARVVASFDDNDDELRKGIADRAYVDGGYPFDVV